MRAASRAGTKVREFMWALLNTSIRKKMSLAGANRRG
jgi:hypothetical protein